MVVVGGTQMKKPSSTGPSPTDPLMVLLANVRERQECTRLPDQE
jgi:hypothetical protein